MNKLCVVLSGRKQSGKTSSCNYIRAKYLNKKWASSLSQERTGIDEEYWTMDNRHHFINSVGELRVKIKDKEYTEEEAYPSNATQWVDGDPVFYPPVLCGVMKSIKTYSFADPLKKFLIDVFGVPHESCYGTDEQKNVLIPHLLWDRIPDMWRPFTEKRHDPVYVEFSGKVADGWVEKVQKAGPMSGREIMQLFGTEVCRRIYGDCWALGTYNSIRNEAYELALVSDSRFPNEITMGNTVNAKTIRLLRAVSKDEHVSETALDAFPLDNYTLVLDNKKMNLSEQCKALDPYIEKWFDEAGI